MKVLILSDNNNEYSRELIHWLQSIGEDIFVREDPIDLRTVKELSPDFVISYNYKHIISKDIVAYYYPRIINLHISLLPYNRGYYPNVWSFLENTPKGVTIHLIDENVDTGDILLQKEVFIDEETETLRSSYLKLHREIQQLFKSNWEALKLGQIHPVKQEGGGQDTTNENLFISSSPLSEKKDGIHPFENLRRNIEVGEVLLKNFIYLNLAEKEMVRRWRNHPEVKKWMYSDHEISEGEHSRFIEKLADSVKDFYYLVYKREKAVGVLYLSKVDFCHRNAYFGIYANPERLVHGAGVILEKSALELAFGIAKFHTLKLEVIENNQRVINFHKRMGFQEEGRLKEFVFKEGKWQDVIIMGMLSIADSSK